jgi:lipopolysaccharide export system permease protein
LVEAALEPAAARKRKPWKVRTRLTRIESYVLVRTLLAVAGALAVIASTIVLVDFVNNSRSLGGRSQDASFGAVLGITLLEFPSTILMLLPFAFLFGVLAAFVNLNRRSELVAMRAAGVSAWRFIFPAAGAAFVIGLVTIMAVDPLASVMNAQSQRIKAGLSEGLTAATPKAIWLRQGDKRTQVIIRAGSQLRSPGVAFKDVTMLVFRVEPNGGVRFARRIDAKQARLMKGAWVLTDAREATPGAIAVSSASVSLPSTLNQRTALERFSSVQAVPFWSLPSVIYRTERAGFSSTNYRLRFAQLLATPLMYVGMSVLAAAFSLRLLRLGGLAMLAGAGVGLGFVLFFLNNLCSALGKGEIIPPFVAAWTPPVLALLAGFTLLCYTEDG